MIRHPQNYWSLLAQDDVDRIHAAALEVLEQKGLCIQSHAILQYLADAGFRIDATHQKVCIRADDIEKHLAAAPQNWTLHGWDSRNNIRFGSDQLYVAAGYGSPFVAEPDGRRRPATLDDFKNFTALAQRCETVDLMSSLMVEPTDVPVRQRGLDIMHCLLSHTEKPLMGPVHSDEAIEDALAMMRIVFGDQGGPHLLALINVNSPLRLDARMAESMLAYLLADQAILLTPGIMMGTTAPVTTAGALVQAWAELLGVAA
ncbi:MAG: trimethylamine methyltransferase family protein, partial [Pirellulales bacterium]|nr:trimethylamine methyltransferase family protein [Pirellulales bacterium]